MVDCLIERQNSFEELGLASTVGIETMNCRVQGIVARPNEDTTWTEVFWGVVTLCGAERNG